MHSLQNVTMVMVLSLSFRELGKSLLLARRHGTLCVKLLFLVTFATLGSVLTLQKFHFVPPDRFGEVVDLACEVQSLGKEPTNHQIINNSFHASNLPSLNDDIVLDKTEIFKSLLLSKSLVEVNLCNRPSSTQGESTSVQFTQTDDSQRFQFDVEMDMLIQDLDPQKFKINPSPISGDFLEDLCHELEFSDSDQALLDLFGSASQKNDVVYQENCQFDFTAGHLFPERLQEFGMKNDVLSYVKSGIPVQLDSPLYSGDIKPKRNSKNVKKNCSVVRNLLGDREEAGHIERVNYKPLVISPLNLVPKSNGSPRLIHNLKVLNRFVKRGPSVIHLNVLELAKSEFSRKTYFVSWIYPMVIFICQLGLRIGRISVFHLTNNTLYLIHFVSATSQPLIIFRLFLRI